MGEVTCFQQGRLYVIQTYGTSIWWATKNIWKNMRALVLMAGMKITPHLSSHGPFVGGNITPSIFHLATWMFSIGQRWWHSRLCPSLCVPPQSQVYMKGDHVPTPQGCVGIRLCLYLLERVGDTYVPRLPKGPPFSHLYILKCSSSLHVLLFLGKRKLWIKPHQPRWRGVEIFLIFLKC